MLIQADGVLISARLYLRHRKAIHPLCLCWFHVLLGYRLELNATLPVGVENGTIVVPRPPYPAVGDPTAAFVVTESGVTVWDGRMLVGEPDGIASARAVPGGVAFAASNGAFEFVAQAPHAGATAAPVLPV
jgi:hypothetical protein